MRFSIRQSALAQLLGTVHKAVASRTTKQVLTGILLEASTNTLKATAYDLDLGIQDTLEPNDDNQLTVYDSGAIVLPARYFTEVVRKLPPTDVQISLQSNYMVDIKASGAQFHLHGIDAAEFPKLPIFHDGRQFQLFAPQWRKLFLSTVFAASNSEARPVLTGVHLQVENQKVVSTATDALRLATSTVTLDLSTEQQWDVVLPAKSVLELARMLTDVNVVIPAQFTAAHSLFSVGKTLFYTRLIDGAYPDTSRIIPTQFKTHVQMNIDVIKDAIDRATLITRERDNYQVKMEITSDRAVVSSSSPDVGNVSEEVVLSHKEGDDITIAFNGRNVLDALQTVNTKEVSIHFNGSNQPFILREDDSAESLQLISPVLMR